MTQPELPELPEFSVYLGGGLYMDSRGMLTRGPELGKPVYPVPGGLPVNLDALASAFKGMAKALPDPEDPDSRKKFDDILDGIGMTADDKNNLINVLQGVGKVASVIGSVVPIVGAVIGFLTTLLGVFKGPSPLEVLIEARFEELRRQIKALEILISQEFRTDRRSKIKAVLAAVTDYKKELDNSPPDEAALRQRRQRVGELLKDTETYSSVSSLLDWTTYLATFDRKEFSAVWPWIPGRLFTFPPSGPPQRALMPQQDESVFYHPVMLPQAFFGVTGFLTALRAYSPEFRSTGEYRTDLRDFVSPLEELATKMRTEGLARTVYTAWDFQGGTGGLAWGLGPEEVVDIPGFDPVIGLNCTRFTVGAMDLRSHNDAYFRPGFYASTVQTLEPQFAKQGLLNVRWVPPARLERYTEGVPLNRLVRRYRITNPEECAAAANAQAEQDYVDLLYSSGYVSLVHLIATVRNEATDPDRSQTVHSWAWLRRKPGASVPVKVKSEPFILLDVITSPAERQQLQYRATASFTTQPLNRDIQLRYRVFLRTLRFSPPWSSGEDYRNYYQVGYTDDPDDPGFKKLVTTTAKELDSFQIPIEGSTELGATSIPETRETNGTAVLQASTFDWWVPVKSPSVKPLAGVEILPGDTISKASLRAAGWEAAPDEVSPPALPTRGGGVSPPRIPFSEAAEWYDAVRDQTQFSDVVGWEEGGEPAGAQRRSVQQKEVQLDYALHWKADRLTVSLKNNRPAEDRNYIVYVVIEETLNSRAVLHTVERVPITGQLTFVPQSFLDEEAAEQKREAGLFRDLARRYAKSLESPLPSPEPGWLGLDRELIAADPVLREFQLTNISDQQDFRRLAIVAAQHPPAATILRQILTEAEVPQQTIQTLFDSASTQYGYVKEEPGCHAEILFLGNVELRPFVEQDDFPYYPQASAELIVDTFVREEFLGIEFTDLSLILEITSPTGVQFVEHSGRDNSLWGIPSDEAWLEPDPASPTTRLRIRDEVASVNRSGDGRTHRVGLRGLSRGFAVNMRAVATACKDNISTSSCVLQIQNLHVGDRIDGPME